MIHTKQNDTRLSLHSGDGSGCYHAPVRDIAGQLPSLKKTQTIPSPPEECDAICSQVWLIPAEQSRPHHTNERRQEITKGARLSLFHTTSCFPNQIIQIFFFFLWVCVLHKCCFCRFLSVCNDTLQGPFPLAVRSESSFACEAEAAFKEKALAPCKSIGQIEEGAHLRVAPQEVTATHS